MKILYKNARLIIHYLHYNCIVLSVFRVNAKQSSSDWKQLPHANKKQGLYMYIYIYIYIMYIRFFSIYIIITRVYIIIIIINSVSTYI